MLTINSTEELKNAAKNIAPGKSQLALIELNEVIKDNVDLGSLFTSFYLEWQQNPDLKFWTLGEQNITSLYFAGSAQKSMAKISAVIKHAPIIITRINPAVMSLYKCGQQEPALMFPEHTTNGSTMIIQLHRTFDGRCFELKLNGNSWGTHDFLIALACFPSLIWAVVDDAGEVYLSQTVQDEWGKLAADFYVGAIKNKVSANAKLGNSGNQVDFPKNG